MAIRSLSHVETAGVDEAILELATEPDLHDQVVAALVPRLAASADTRLQDAAVSLLARADVPDFVINSVHRGGNDALWRAWELTRNPQLIPQLAYTGDRRAAGPLAELLVDDQQPVDLRMRLVLYASWPQDPSVIPALLTAAELGTAPLLRIGEALRNLGAAVDAIAMLSRAAREEDPNGLAAMALAEIDHPDVGHVLLALFQEQPSAALASPLARFEIDGVVEALARAAHDPDLRRAVVTALESRREPAAVDALAELAATEHRALRALARRRDQRARERLLEMLDDRDPEIAREGAEGLRDLRDPTTAPELLRAIDKTADETLMTVAVHALISIQAPERVVALECLRASDNPSVRKLADLWSDR